MTSHIDKVRVLDDTPRRFSAEAMDPRNAETVEVRDGMIAMRRSTGLADFPARPLYPHRQVHFEPEPLQVTRGNTVAE
ncbi:MAG: hypothetical protein WKF63_00830 [Thermomicrobiales bacterium]